MTFASRVIDFNKNLDYDGTLPDGIRLMNPFRESPNALEISSAFYQKLYNDDLPRKLILGINPGRFGAGVTGIPFTDTKRLRNKCRLPHQIAETHEPSSVFIYRVIDRYGGVKRFYSEFYINSVVPLGFVKLNEKGGEINYNYYDQTDLMELIKPFAARSIQKHIEVGCHRDKVFCLGTGKNLDFLTKLNQEYGFFKKIVPLEHPRYIMQYKSKQMDIYIAKYLGALKGDGSI